nr:hypothetical protein [Algoriphagus sp.]
CEEIFGIVEKGRLAYPDYGQDGPRFKSCHPDNKGSSEPKSLQILRFAGFFIFYVSVRFRQFQQK